MRNLIVIAALAAFSTLAGCASTVPRGEAPGLDTLRNMTYPDIGDTTVTLVDGAWEGEPFVEGSAMRPTVHFVRDFVLTADLDGDGSGESVALLEHAAGGTGRFAILAVVGALPEGPVVLASTNLGDRVKLVSAAIAGDKKKQLRMELLVAGPEDGACCPRDLVTRAWTFDGRALTPVDAGVPARRVSLAEVAEEEWILRAWSFDEEAPAEPAVTLTYEAGRFSGRNGCNRYFLEVEETEPTRLAVGRAGSTKMYCPEPAAGIEERYMAILEKVTDYGFMGGQLTLGYEVDGEFGLLFFERRERKESR